MHENDTPDRSGTGLSTDDIARSSTAGADPGGDRDERGGQGSDRPPLYPGEAIQTPDGGGRDTGTEAVSGDSTGTETETAGATGTRTGTGTAADRSADESPRLMDPGDEEDFKNRWHELQSLFVDDPRRAVHEADALVADVMQKLAATFADHRRSLEGQWRQGEDVDTESLRTALVRYRSFFHRLLHTGADRETAGSGGADTPGRERPAD
ncbi:MULTISPECIES: hypothetical protein [Streptomyces]|uniref:Uncharacterized protein n=2 Tax=Streptomyces TaxID=1883 RepID=A0ABU4KHS6_9ACTN|nr:hypothetical protein [Streptomyces roseolus]MDX2297360.1 hypothetical protein [Streptomyces roseolus]